jgi:hypothetical protein
MFCSKNETSMSLFSFDISQSANVCSLSSFVHDCLNESHVVSGVKSREKHLLRTWNTKLLSLSTFLQASIESQIFCVDYKQPHHEDITK